MTYMSIFTCGIYGSVAITAHPRLRTTLHTQKRRNTLEQALYTWYYIRRNEATRCACIRSSQVKLSQPKKLSNFSDPGLEIH